MKRNILKWCVILIAFAINLFILINGLIPGETSANQSNTIAQTAAKIINDVRPNTITEINFELFAFNFRKVVGHFLLFAFSGGFSTWAFYFLLNDSKAKYFVWEFLISFGLGIFVASLSEIFQLIVPGRGPSFFDVGIDVLGYFVGDLLVIFVLFLTKKPIFKREKKLKSQAN